eukprot:6176311-Pleurochrysis_carterae.AAC.3
MATSSVMKLLLLLLLLQLLTHGVAAFAAKGGKSAQKKKSPAAATRGFGAKAAPNTAEKAEAAALRNAVAATSSELQRDPRNPQLWLQLGALMVKSGEYAEAERVFRCATGIVSAENTCLLAKTCSGDTYSLLSASCRVTETSLTVAATLLTNVIPPHKQCDSFDSLESNSCADAAGMTSAVCWAMRLGLCSSRCHQRSQVLTAASVEC